jgi:glucosamine kinase
MLLVADSGSTKSDWVLVKNDGVRLETSTMGFNPFFHDEDFIESELNKNELFSEYASQVKTIRFFGAGSSSVERKKIIEVGLKRVFNQTDSVIVDHDVMAASIATSQGKPGIVCILGTGSNSIYYDGHDVSEKVPALGYILGDEGSGAYFGKQILTKYLYKKFPTDLKEAFELEYGINKDVILESVYKKPHANVYLASFMKFAHKNQEHPFFREMIYQGFASFVGIHVCCYENFREVPVNFVGSVAFYFRNVLEVIAKNYRFTLGTVIKKPIESLADFYSENK